LQFLAGLGFQTRAGRARPAQCAVLGRWAIRPGWYILPASAPGGRPRSRNGGSFRAGPRFRARLAGGSSACAAGSECGLDRPRPLRSWQRCSRCHPWRARGSKDAHVSGAKRTESGARDVQATQVVRRQASKRLPHAQLMARRPYDPWSRRVPSAERTRRLGALGQHRSHLMNRDLLPLV
jgi:hypothetical protein